MFASTKGKQQKYPILPFEIVACAFLPTTFLETAVYACWLFFSIAFFGRKDFTDFYYFWHP